MLAWLVDEHAIEPHIPVFDKSARDDGTSPAGTSPTIRNAISLAATAQNLRKLAKLILPPALKPA
jgi:hypothetical protein